MATSKAKKTEEKTSAEIQKELMGGRYGAMMNQAKKNGTFEVMTPKFIEFSEPGFTVVGEFKGSSEVGGGDGKKSYNQYVFDTDMGPVKFHLGNVTDAEAGAVMEKGNVYAIQFLGQVEIPGGKRVNKFEIILLTTGDERRVGGQEDNAI